MADYALAPGRTHLVYRADAGSTGTLDLFWVDLSGPSPAAAQQVSGAVGPGGVASDVAFAPDGGAVFYRAEQVGVVEAYEVALDEVRYGTWQPFKLNFGGAVTTPLAVVGGSVQSLSVVAKGEAVVLQGDLDRAGVSELYRIHLRYGSWLQKLNAPPVTGGQVVGYAISPR